jgi:predicted nucleic acid-binding Zn ribbon protein
MPRKFERKASVAPLKEVIEEFLVTYRLKDKMYNAKALQAWESAVGEMVARHTQRISIRNRVLFVKVDSSVVRNELVYARKKIITTLNRYAGRVVIDDIVLS